MNSKIIIYDDSCPLCAAYTGAFVQTGLIDREGRKNFSTIQPDLLAMVDIKRSVNEIPVIDTSTKQVWYGIDALLELLSQKIPIIKTVGNFKPIKWILKKLYKFISYNRRVIVAKNQAAHSFDCTPDFNFSYRIIFMLVFLVFNTGMLYPLHHYLAGSAIFKSTTIRELQYAHTCLVVINITLAIFPGKKQGVEYLGQVNMLALVTIMSLIPLIIINKFPLLANTTIQNMYLGILTIFMIHEYTRRMKFAKIISQYPWIVVINGVSVITFLLYLIL